MRDTYEKIRNLGGGNITPVGSATITDLDGILSTGTTSTDAVKSVEFLAVSSHHRAERDFRSPTPTGHPRSAGK